MATQIYSFGFRHRRINSHALILDVRKHFSRNPYHDPRLRGLRGTDREVQEDIEKTPNFEESYDALKILVASYDGSVYLGCTGGHHRSVYLAERLSRELNIPVVHLELEKERTHNALPSAR